MVGEIDDLEKDVDEKSRILSIFTFRTQTIKKTLRHLTTTLE
jgi:hypothetical protein